MKSTRTVKNMRNHRTAAALALAVMVALSTACSDSNDVLTPPGGGATGLTVSAADPLDGNGTINSANVYYDTNQGMDNLDKVTISATDSDGSTGHEIEVYWVPGTLEVRSVQHYWGPMAGGASGATGCATGTANVCSNVTVDPATKTVDLNGIVLLDSFGGTDTSTLTGSVQWP